VIAPLFASPAFAQDSTVNALAAAGFGANEIHFDVKTDKKQHPTAQPMLPSTLDHVVSLDQDLVNQVATALTRAAELCGGKRNQ
jgi:hypothetical protein